MPHWVHGGAPLTFHFMFTLVIKPDPRCVEGNLCSWMCSFPLLLPVDIPGHQEGLLKPFSPDTIPPIRMGSRMTVYLWFTPFQMFPRAPCSALALTGNCLWDHVQMVIAPQLWKPRTVHSVQQAVGLIVFFFLCLPFLLLHFVSFFPQSVFVWDVCFG